MEHQGSSRRSRGSGDTPPTYAYEPVPGVPPVTVLRFHESSGGTGARPPAHAHAHDFLVLIYFERGGGSLRLADRWWTVQQGDAVVIAPGDVVGLGAGANPLQEGMGWAVSFPVDVLGQDSPGAWLSWRTHPLLLPFVRGAGGAAAQRLRVPSDQQPRWSERFAALDAELHERQDGYQEAVLAHLTLLLVQLSRLAADVVGDLRLRDEPLLADVFDFIEEHFGEPVSLRDVAQAVSLSPGHLTTVVRRSTGRTVGDWITERRMAQARRLLVETDFSVDEVGRRVGYRDPAYFVRVFKRVHRTTPLRWRRAGRG